MANFYIVDQQNSGGSFVVNENVCHRIVIEANSESEATSKAEELGCYWNGCNSGVDCPCCGDRWYGVDIVELDKWKEQGYPVSVYNIYDNPEDRWFKLYGSFPRLKEPVWEERYNSKSFNGLIYFNNIEQYCQYLANNYGFTTPDIRIFYLDGRKTEIFTVK